MSDSIRHYLDTHADYRVDEETRALGAISIAYGYHYSGEHHLKEQRSDIPPEALSAKERKLPLDVHAFVEAKIRPPAPVRLPHATITPQITLGVFTFVAQDQRQAAILPVARLYYYEVAPEIRSQIERQIRLEGPEWSTDEAPVARRLRAWVRARAWRAYSAQVAQSLHA